jgi:hypothetical protein
VYFCVVPMWRCPITDFALALAYVEIREDGRRGVPERMEGRAVVDEPAVGDPGGFRGRLQSAAQALDRFPPIRHDVRIWVRRRASSRIARSSAMFSCHTADTCMHLSEGRTHSAGICQRALFTPRSFLPSPHCAKWTQINNTTIAKKRTTSIHSRLASADFITHPHGPADRAQAGHGVK